MSMTREEAITAFEEIKLNAQTHLGKKYAIGCEEYYKTKIDLAEAAISALRTPTREQVERMFPGCDFCNCADFGEFGFEITKHYAKICCALGSWRFPQNEQFMFCPKCGKPLTDEAVDIMLERWKEAVDGE